MKKENEWSTYRTRFLVKARQLSRSMRFVDALGREHQGKKGDYLMECDGLRRIAPKEFFEDVYVPIDFVPFDEVLTLTPLRKSPAMATGKTLRRQQSA